MVISTGLFSQLQKAENLTNIFLPIGKSALSIQSINQKDSLKSAKKFILKLLPMVWHEFYFISY
jgi:hypothetical protein